MFKKLHRAEGGFTLVELLVTIAILAVLFGVVTLSLTGVGSSAEDTVNDAELGIVQSAVDIYMAENNVSTITSGGGTTHQIDTGDFIATYFRDLPSNCYYSWDTAGNVTQEGCP